MSSSRTDVLVDVTMPQMGVSVAEGTVVAWRVELGDRIEAEATICEISTDKIDTEVPSPATGVVAEILVPVGETVDVGTVMARIAVGGDGVVPVSAGEAPEPLDGDTAGPPATEPSSQSPRRPRPAATERRIGATRPSSSGSPPSTGSTCRRCPAPGAAGACASRTCWRSWEASRSRSRRCTSRARTGPTRCRRRQWRSRRRSRWRLTVPAASCRGCAGRSAST